nr:hypothetical protein [Tanacetum cinerariifolium]
MHSVSSLRSCFGVNPVKENGVVERRNRTLIEAAHTMLIYAKASLFLWTEAVATTSYTQNRPIIRLYHGKTPYELLHDKLLDLSFFHVFGALFYLTNDSDNLGKLQPKADIGIFIRYAPTKKAFRIYNRHTRRIIEKIHVDFDELIAMASDHSSLEPAFHEMTHATISSRLMPNPPPSTPVDLPAHEVIALIAEVVALEPVESTSSPSSTTVDQDAPSASNSQTSPKTQSLVISIDVEENNHDLDVAHMNNDQFFGISILENISETSSFSDVIPTVVHTAAPNSEHVNKWTKDHPLDNIIGELERPITTRLQLHEQALFCYYDAFLTSVEPKTYKDALTQSCWIEAMQEELNEFERLEVWKLVPRLVKEFSKGTVDPTLFIRRKGKDILLISQSPRGIFLNQSKYALESLKKYDMKSSDPVDSPMVEKSKLDEDTQGKAVEPIHYHGMVGTLMYLTANRLDQIFVVCMCARYQAKPTEKHLNAAKRIFKYLRGTVNRGLWYQKDSSIAQTSYANADHVGCQDTTRSTSKSMQLVGERLASWSQKGRKALRYPVRKLNILPCLAVVVKFHFIKEQVENRVVELYFVNTEYQLADIFTKALSREIIKFLINKLGMRSFTLETLKHLADEAEE